MNNEFLKLFQILKQASPTEEYLSRGKENLMQQISFTPQVTLSRTRLFEGIRMNAALTMAAAVLLFVIGSASYFNSHPSIIGQSFDNNALAREISELDFQIQINEAEYFNDSALQIALALEEISK